MELVEIKRQKSVAKRCSLWRVGTLHIFLSITKMSEAWIWMLLLFFFCVKTRCWQFCNVMYEISLEFTFHIAACTLFLQNFHDNCVIWHCAQTSMFVRECDNTEMHATLFEAMCHSMPYHEITSRDTARIE